MRRTLGNILTALIACFAIQPASYADTVTDSIAKAFDDDLVSLSFRYRYENVDSDRLANDANANTLKTSLTLAPKLGDFLFLAQIDDVRHIGSDKFNDTRNGKTQYPLVVDPQGTGVNQLFVRYSGIKNTPLTLGRQRINRINQRHVGGVGWRQNEQTFDSVSVGHDADNFSLYYAYVGKVDRLFGPDSGTPARQLDSSSSLVDVSYTFSPMLKVFGYGYFLDFKDDAPVFSSRTFGLRGTGEFELGESASLAYQAEFASQGGYANNPVSYDANYYLLDADLSVSNFGVRAGYEVLGGDKDAGLGYQTPLATLHKFQGWADMFVVTPKAGVKDGYMGVTAKAFGGEYGLTYHDFRAEQGSAKWGDEIDAYAKWKFAQYYSVLLQIASYKADQYLIDTTKAWVQLQASW